MRQTHCIEAAAEAAAARAALILATMQKIAGCKQSQKLEHPLELQHRLGILMQFVLYICCWIWNPQCFAILRT